ncbi:hypothetical protein MMC30_001827 [Trapelia coarctata]|nr:hypothetical protein [Trapelia coarctata]
MVFSNTIYGLFVAVVLYGINCGASSCVDWTIPVTITANTFIVAFAPFTNNTEAMAWVNSALKRDPFNPFSGIKSITETFSISARYCTPETPFLIETLQILTHGASADKTYWDFKLVPGEYSYVDAALKAGYSTFTWDRLGSGNSSKPDPYNVVQAPVELAILVELTKLLRAGSVIVGSSAYKNYVHVGHSYGSDLSNYLAAVEPKLSDGIILTGYSNNFSHALPFFAATGHLASTNQPNRFAGYSSGYITWADMYYAQFAFFAFPYFDAKVLGVTEQTKWPLPLGEALTQGVLNISAPAFTGPVLVCIPLLGDRN